MHFLEGAYSGWPNGAANGSLRVPLAAEVMLPSGCSLVTNTTLQACLHAVATTAWAVQLLV